MQTNESFLPGNYSYPFSFQVPTGIPGTYAHDSGYGVNKKTCSVTYTLYAELIINGGGSDLIGRSGCPIVIMQQARTPYNYDMDANITNKVTTWCCIDRGNVGVKCKFEKDVVRMDESVSMRFSIDNKQCKAKLSQVEAILKRKLFLRCKNGMTTFKEDNMIKLPLPGCEAGGEVEEKIVKFDLNLAQDHGTPANLAGALGEFAGKIQGTCNGQLITVSYELHVIAKVDGCMCCSTHPFVYAPIEILAPERVLVFTQEIYAPVPIEQVGVQPLTTGVPLNTPQQVMPAATPHQVVPTGYPPQDVPPAPVPDGTNQQVQYGSPGFTAQQYKVPVGAKPVKGTTQKLEQKAANDASLAMSEDV